MIDKCDTCKKCEQVLSTMEKMNLDICEILGVTPDKLDTAEYDVDMQLLGCAEEDGFELDINTFNGGYHSTDTKRICEDENYYQEVLEILRHLFVSFDCMMVYLKAIEPEKYQWYEKIHQSGSNGKGSK